MGVTFFRRFRERKIGQWAIVYLAAGWVFLEALGFVADTFGWPEFIVRSAVIVVGIGFLALMTLAWFHGEKGHQRVSGLELGLLTALLLVAGVLVVWVGRGGDEMEQAGFASAPLPLTDGPSVAVLPFEVRGPDMELWREGLVDLLSINLDGPTLRAIDSRTVLARWHERIPAEMDADLALALEVARTTGARQAVLGTAVATGSRVRLAARVLDLPDGELVEQVQVDGPADSMIALVDRLSIALLRDLLGGGGRQPTADLASVTTTSIEALKAFLEGEQLYRRGEYGAAEDAYDHAVATDTLFALAYYRLGLARGWTEAALRRMHRPPLERAAELSASLPRREAGLVRAALAVATNDAGGIDSARALAERYPDDPEAWNLLGELYFHLGEQRQVGWQETEEAFRRAVELDPGWAPYHIHLVDLALSYHADSALTAERIERYRRLAPETVWNEYFEQVSTLAFGDASRRDPLLAKLETADPRTLSVLRDRLTHPRFHPGYVEVVEIMRRVGNDSIRAELIDDLFFNTALARGHIREALAYLEDPYVQTSFPACAMMSVQLTTRVLPESTLDSALPRDVVAAFLEAEPSDPGQIVGLMACGSLYARLRGWSEEQESLHARLLVLRDGLAAEDSADAAQLSTIIEMIDGYGHWVDGDAEAAYEALRDIADSGETPAGNHLWGTLLLDVGRPAEALPYLVAERSRPIAHLYLGHAYEALGRDAEAREAYEFFLTWWAEADPEFAPLLIEAREGLARIAERLN